MTHDWLVWDVSRRAALRKALVLVLVTTLMGWLTGGWPAPAKVEAAGHVAGTLTVGDSEGMLEGRSVSLHNPVRLMDGNAWGPVRSLAAGLGAAVSWDGNLRRATVVLGGKNLQFTVGRETAMINGSSVQLPGAPAIAGGRMQVPLRALLEGLGFALSYDAATGTLQILREVASGAPASPPPPQPAEPTVRAYDHPELGPVLVDAEGMVLYVFTRDEENLSNCYGPCEENWPVLVAEGTPVAGEGVRGTLGVTTRNDGTRQVTYDGMPLYYFARDAQAGDATGQGLNGVWFVASPDPSDMAPATIEIASHPELGQILADTYGRTLYMFVPDEPGVSNCYGTCEDNWPVLRGQPTPAEGVSVSVGSTRRNDGTDQITINDMPMYYFVADRLPGQAEGQGVNDVWFVLAPDGTVIGLP